MANLQKYRKKRDFTKSAEPDGSKPASKGKSLRFVIQKHDASRLHYDLRLEIDGVYKSWAVPKEPSLNPLQKRLAVEVEDHPIDYGTFEGTIPKGEYGGGTVMIWDKGTYQTEGDPTLGHKEGELKLKIEGERLRGKWALVRMKPKPEDGETRNWLWIKEKDDATSEKRELTESFTTSVASGRTMEDIAEARPIRAKKSALPEIMRPQLATLSENVPEGDEWIHEIKFDGYRILARIEKGKVILLSRNGLDWTTRFQSIADSLLKLKLDSAIFDGEVVILDGKGVADFGALQNYVSTGKGELVFFAFDLLHLNGADCTSITLLNRKAKLKEVIVGGDNVRYSDHVVGGGAQFFKHACTSKLEGIVSKRGDSTYQQKRSRTWLKVKCEQRQEFVVAGFTDPSGSRGGFGALLVGFYDGGKLIYCGRVGTGFSDRQLADTFRALKPLERSTSPFSTGPVGLEAKGVRYVKPKLVCEVSFSSWTQDGRLRHPVFLGFRDDKPVKEVAMESSTSDKGSIAGVTITHPERVIDQVGQVTKLELAEYFEAISKWLLPHISNRPLAIVRCPQGQDDPCFFQKNHSDTLPAAIDPVDLGEGETGIGVNNPEGLVSLAQFGAIEIHPWGSQAGALDQPDRITFDLDPGPGLTWADVVVAARDTRKLLKALGLESWVKTSGGKGLHVCLNIKPNLDWKTVKEFARSIALLLEEQNPERYVSSMSKSKRGKKVFIDYLRNGRGATSVAAFSPRARPGTPVSTPVRWDELSKITGANHFTVKNVLARLRSLKTDPWADFLESPQDLKSRLESKRQKVS